MLWATYMLDGVELRLHCLAGYVLCEANSCTCFLCAQQLNHAWCCLLLSKVSRQSGCIYLHVRFLRRVALYGLSVV